MKTVLLGFAYFGWMLTLISAPFVAIDFQPIFGNKFTYNDVFMFAFISIASSGLWLVFNAQEKNERPK
jgi:hypothetical protein